MRQKDTQCTYKLQAKGIFVSLACQANSQLIKKKQFEKRFACTPFFSQTERERERKGGKKSSGNKLVSIKITANQFVKLKTTKMR